MTIKQNLTTVNRWVGTNNPQWICMHYTANGKSYKGMAWNNTNYFKSAYRAASAHYFIDDEEIWQCVADADSAWHCGDAASRNGCTNRNSIGIEICDNNGEFTAKAEALAVELVKHLMRKYGIPVQRVCRHYDVTGKICPKSWARDSAKWNNFLTKLTASQLPATNKSTASHIYNGIDKGRWIDDFIVYRSGASTGTNQWGFEAPVDSNGVVLSNPEYKGNTAIPKGGFVISGHGNSANWIYSNIKAGYYVTVNANGYVYVDKWQHRTVDGVNTSRPANALCVYNKGKKAPTNEWGYEVAIDAKGFALTNPKYKGQTEIPSGGFVLSGHLNGKNSGGAWIYANIHKGTAVRFDGKTVSIVQ